MGNNWFFDKATNLVFTENDRLIRESWISHPQQPGNMNKPAAEYMHTRTAIVLRCQHDNYFHTMVDNLPRLHLLGLWLDAHPGETLDILLPKPLNNAERYWIPRMLHERMRLKEIPMEIERIHVSRMAYSPPYSRRFKGALPIDYLRYFRSLAGVSNEHILRNTFARNRVFISRPSGVEGGRELLNENALFFHLKKRGFYYYRLEDLTMDEQIYLFCKAEIVVGAHGAGLTNLLFSPSDTSVLELFPGRFIIPHYFYLSSSLDQDYHFLFGDALSRNDAFNIDVEEVLDVVEQMISRRRSSE